jgi:Protein O-mannosyl-transferase TMEM260-like
MALTAAHRDPDSTAGPPRLSRSDWLWLAGVASFLALVYAWKLQPGIAPHGDISKFQFAGPTGGTAHQTGYPLYLALTWLAAHTSPWIGTGTAVTALSAACMLGAVALSFVALRMLDVRPPIAAAFAVVLGAAPYVMYYAVVAEVYALHLLFVSALLVTLLRWRATRSDVDLMAAIVLLALSFTHHMTTVLLVPGILVYVWMVDRRTFLRPRVWLVGAGALLMAVLSYGFLIWRAGDPSVPFLEVAPHSWADLPAIWFGAGAADSFTFDPRSLVAGVPGVAMDVVRSTILALPLALFGARALGRSATGAMLGLWVMAGGLFALAFRIPDLAGFLIPIVFVAVLLAGVGMEWLADRYTTSRGLLDVTLVFVAVVAVLVGVAFVDKQAHGEYAARTRAWLAKIPNGAVVAADYPDAMAAFHLAILEGTRTDLVIVSDYPLADPEGSVIGRYLDGATVEVPHTRQQLAPGRAVYAPGRGWACELHAAGFGVERVSDELYRVLPYGGPPADAAEACDD